MIMKLTVDCALLRLLVGVALIIVFVGGYARVVCLTSFGNYCCLLCVMNLVYIFRSWITRLIRRTKLKGNFLVNPGVSIEELIWFISSEYHYPVLKILPLKLSHFLIHQDCFCKFLKFPSTFSLYF